MITEDYVSFETAKLLKEKGFDEKCHCSYRKKLVDDKIVDEEELFVSANLMLTNSELEDKAYRDIVYCSAPTLQLAMKWLREKHNQNVTVKAHNNVARLKTIYYAEVQNLLEPGEKGFCVNGCVFKDTYEEAVEYAINYCLKILI